MFPIGSDVTVHCTAPPYITASKQAKGEHAKARKRKVNENNVQRYTKKKSESAGRLIYVLKGNILDYY